ncbi:hypothetical protein FOA52_014435 [Chlamydomonas sp. UWO 241]|nr:hypothetical protein FOA52_014435 [Chlamydomonas sp. UWO 241]
MPPRSKRTGEEETAAEPTPRRSSRKSMGSKENAKPLEPRHHEVPARFATGDFVVGVEAQQARKQQPATKPEEQVPWSERVVHTENKKYADGNYVLDPKIGTGAHARK